MDKFDCESPEYGEQMLKWFLNIDTDLDVEKHEVGESYTAIVTNLFPFNNLIVDITTVNGKSAVIFQYPTSSVAAANHINPIIKIYYPEKVEVAFHNYDKNGKYMFAARVDNLFWIYNERFQHMPNGSFSNFGMDMTMPFLEQQNFREL